MVDGEMNYGLPVQLDHNLEIRCPTNMIAKEVTNVYTRLSTNLPSRLSNHPVIKVYLINSFLAEGLTKASVNDYLI